MDATVFGAWVATGLTLFIFSFLYKDNPLFKLAEHLYVGVSVGYTIVKAYDTVIVHLIVKPIFMSAASVLWFSFSPKNSEMEAASFSPICLISMIRSGLTS